MSLYSLLTAIRPTRTILDVLNLFMDVKTCVWTYSETLPAAPKERLALLVIPFFITSSSNLLRNQVSLDLIVLLRRMPFQKSFVPWDHRPVTLTDFHVRRSRWLLKT